MRSDLANDPQPSDWFVEEVEYTGYGSAHFSDPNGSIKGPATVQVDKLGRCAIEMRIEEFETKESLVFGYDQFFSGSRPEMAGGSISLGVGGSHNPCESLRVHTDVGVLTASEKILYEPPIAILEVRPDVSIRLLPLQCQFIAHGQQVPKYWVLPINNFIADFTQRSTNLEQHPFRIFPTTAIPEDLSPEERNRAQWVNYQKNRLIVFDFGSSLGFIESVPDYEERAEALLKGEARSSMTALMIGEVHSDWDHRDAEQAETLSSLLLALSFATGTSVGAPWIEYRGANGELIARNHTQLNQRLYEPGRPILNREIGRFLSCFAASPAYGKTYFDVVLKQLVYAGLDYRTIEEKLRHLVIAVEGLCLELGLKQPQTLGQKYLEEIEKMLRQASKCIKQTAGSAKSEGLTGEAKTLKRIAQKVEGSKKVFPGFTGYLKALLDHYKLPDEAILGRHYRISPRPDGKSWIKAMAKYRGVVMHRGYVGFEKIENLYDAMALMYHLNDILVRIVFKIVGYEGRYRSPIKGDDVPHDWVKPDLLANRLGYTDGEEG